MKKLALVAVLSVGFLTACAPKEVEEVKVQENTIQTTISIIAEGAVIEEKEVTLDEGATLQEAMKENFDIVEEEGFVTTIEEVAQSEEENKWWMFEVNEEQPTEGADTFVPEEDDSIVWELTEF